MDRPIELAATPYVMKIEEASEKAIPIQGLSANQFQLLLNIVGTGDRERESLSSKEFISIFKGAHSIIGTSV